MPSKKGHMKGHPPYKGCEKGGPLGAPHGIKGGRPVEWTDERIQNAADNLNEYLDRTRTDKTMFWWKDWCFDYGILPSKCSELAKQHKGFCEVYRRACEWQEQTVVKYALAKKFSDNFSQFYLKTQHRDRWRENEETNIGESIVSQFESIVSMLESRQAKNDLNISDKSIKEATKS